MLDWLKTRVAVWAANTITTSQELEKVLLDDRGALAGVNVSSSTAMRVSAVNACVRVLAETLAQVPLAVMTTNGDLRERATDHPTYKLLHDKPNSLHTSFEWRELMQAHLGLRGNAYSFVNRVRRGSVVREIVPLHPDGMTVESNENREVVYKYSDGYGKTTEYKSSQILHLRGLALDKDFVRGINPIQQHRESIGTAMAADNHAAMSLGNGAKPGGILSNDVVLKDEQAKRLIKQFEDQAAGLKSGGTAVMDGGWKYSPVAMTNRDAQFIEQLKYRVVDIARIYRVPPHMIQDLERATFSNISEQSIEFVRYTMLPWFVRWEQRINATLFPNEPDLFVKFSLEGLLRGTPKERAEFYQAMRAAEAISPNEIREKEDMNPRTDPGGDDYSNPNINPTGNDDDSEQDEESV